MTETPHPCTRVAGRRRTRRATAVLAALPLFGMLAACSPQGTGDGGAASSDQECRTVEHALGSSCVPLDPQRIVTIDPIGVLPTLVDLGVPVVGASAVYSETEPFPDYLETEQTQGITVVGTSAEPNFEGIAALNPDLIVGSELYVNQFQDKLEAIAPTVAVRDTFYTPELEQVLASIAEVVGKADLFAEQWSAFERQQGELGTRLAEEYPSGLTVSRVDGYPEQTYAYRWTCLWYGPILAPLGMQEPEQQRAECDVYADWSTAVIQVSDENLSVIDAEVIFGYSSSQGGDETTPFTEALSASPLWTGLSAVQEQRVFDLGDAWGLGASLPAARKMLDDVEQSLLP